ncbi:MAG: ribonuclease Z [Bacteroidia bacterium]|nr:ribonuclease Z [Bacteroidia bacterium]NNM15168.1 ribonuclease Z [Bacteroidia bacterium]
MSFEVTILGSSSAAPVYNRHPSSQVLNIREKLFLIDCGEGTQIQMMRYKIRHNRIRHIFISHLHGDHYLGLMGLLSTMNLQGRTTELHLYAQAELMDLIETQLRLSNTVLRYNLIFHPTKYYLNEVIMEDDDVTVRTVILNHRIPCTGFVFKEKPKPRKLLISKIQRENIPFEFYNRLKAGEDYKDHSGKIIKNEDLTKPSAEPLSYAYCSDTIFDESIIPSISGVDMLYHESTFMHEHRERAKATYHSTSIQAATIATKANVKKLIIGHFSARYRNLEPMLTEARDMFENTELAIEGSRFTVDEHQLAE